MKKIIYLVFLATLTLIVVGGTLYYVSQKKPVATPLRKPTPIVQDCSVTDTGVIDAINVERTKLGITPVVYSDYLDKIAGDRAVQLKGTMDNHVGFRAMMLSNNDEIYSRYHAVDEDLSAWQGCNNSSVRVGYFRSSQKHWDSLMRPTQDVVGVAFIDNVLVVILGDIN